MLRITNLSKSFGGFSALSGLDLTLAEKERHAIIGPNGAGKSTFFNCITGHLRPTTGAVHFRGNPIVGLPPYRIVKLGIARSFQRVNIFPRMTVFENVQTALIADRSLNFNLVMPGAPLRREETAAVLGTVGLAGDASVAAGLLSYGKQKQLELAIALAAEPQLLLLDEPTAGMSPQETADTISLILEIAKSRGLTLLFTEHDMDFVFRLADRITVLHHGKFIASGIPDEVRNDEQVRRVYLGEDEDAAA
jgi:branched-chain amino acid transport system ATP-binding protein